MHLSRLQHLEVIECPLQDMPCIEALTALRNLHLDVTIAKGGTTAPTILNKQYCANYIEKYQKPINAEIHQRSIKSKQELQVTDPQQINSDRSGSEHATLEGLVLCGARTRQRQRAATVC